MRRHCIAAALFVAMSGLILSALAQEHTAAVSSSSPAAGAADGTAASDSSKSHGSTSSKAATSGATEASLRLEGEKRFRANCGRCHQPPHKFPPRVMATAIRHMRVRAMITDEDMRLILRYMTE